MPDKPNFYGWKLVAVLFALDFINMGFPYYGGSVINGYMVHEVGMSRSTLGLGFTLLMACVFVVNLFGDRWLYIEVNGFLWVMLACVVRGQMIENEKKQEALESSNEIAVAEPQWENEQELVLV